jgi:hypothetical protein
MELVCYAILVSNFIVYTSKFLLLHIVQTGSGVHPTSSTMGTGALSRGKAAGA